MYDTRSQIIMAVFAWIPYVLVSWGYAKLTGGSFWPALGVLVVVRLFFSAIETLGSVLAWRIYGRKAVVERNLSLLRASNFPKRQNAHDDFLSYLGRIESDETSSQQLKAAAKQWEQVLAFFESSGILLGVRMHAAADAALDVYSPKNEAPLLGTTAA
ncbi:MAG TPA: hypothetical protein PKV98_01405 [Burkholderiaceae bacterium]|nr:hypothetical protein [Burkholderiaceae bacterium]